MSSGRWVNRRLTRRLFSKGGGVENDIDCSTNDAVGPGSWWRLFLSDDFEPLAVKLGGVESKSLRYTFWCAGCLSVPCDHLPNFRAVLRNSCSIGDSRRVIVAPSSLIWQKKRLNLYKRLVTPQYVQEASMKDFQMQSDSFVVKCAQDDSADEESERR